MLLDRSIVWFVTVSCDRHDVPWCAVVAVVEGLGTHFDRCNELLPILNLARRVDAMG